MAGRYQQLKMEFGGEEVAAESLREALKYARRAVERGDKITHPDVLMLLDLFEMEAGNAVAEEVAPCECELLREQLKNNEKFHQEGARRMNDRIVELQEELRNRNNALTTRITQVASLQEDLEKAGKLVENISRKAREWEKRWNEATDRSGELQNANRKAQQLLASQEVQLEAQAVRIDQLSREKTRLTDIASNLSDQIVSLKKQAFHVEGEDNTTRKFATVLAKSVPFFARKNKEYGNAVESTGVRGSVVALTGDVARLRVMLREPVLDIDNIRDKLQDVLVQAGIGIVLLDTGNVDGKGV